MTEILTVSNQHISAYWKRECWRGREEVREGEREGGSEWDEGGERLGEIPLSGESKPSCLTAH